LHAYGGRGGGGTKIVGPGAFRKITRMIIILIVITLQLTLVLMITMEGDRRHFAKKNKKNKKTK
jgi:hypothetical protein